MLNLDQVTYCSPYIPLPQIQPKKILWEVCCRWTEWTPCVLIELNKDNEENEACFVYFN